VYDSTSMAPVSRAIPTKPLRNLKTLAHQQWGRVGHRLECRAGCEAVCEGQDYYWEGSYVSSRSLLAYVWESGALVH
jgi:hypothetical protein